MSTASAIDRAANPTVGAFASTLQSMRQSWLRHVLVVGGTCVGIALLLTAIDGRGFAVKLVYSVCIGTVCTLTVDATRLAVAWFTDLLRRRKACRWRRRTRAGAVPSRVRCWPCCSALPSV